MHVTLEVEIDHAEPPQGSLRTDTGELRTFAGWLELMSVLHEALGPRRAEQPR